MSLSSSKKRIVVLRGGPSTDYAASLKTGEHMLSLLREKEDMYEPVDVFISKDGKWHHEGIEKDPHKTLEHADVVLNALHGHFGEDGKIQKILSSMQIPYTGSTSVSSALSNHPEIRKQVFARHGLHIPHHEIITEEDNPKKLVSIFRNYLHPIVVKSMPDGGEKTTRLVYTLDELIFAVDEALESSSKALVEEFIRGKEAVVTVIDQARGEKLYALMPVEIVTPMKGRIPDHASKFKEEPEYKIPTSFSTAQNKRLEEVAKLSHEALGMRHYSNSNLIITPSGKIYILDTNALPKFYKDSMLSRALAATGWTAHEFLEHILNLALSY